MATNWWLHTAKVVNVTAKIMKWTTTTNRIKTISKLNSTKWTISFFFCMVKLKMPSLLRVVIWFSHGCSSKNQFTFKAEKKIIKKININNCSYLFESVNIGWYFWVVCLQLFNYSAVDQFEIDFIERCRTMFQNEWLNHMQMAFRTWNMLIFFSQADQLMCSFIEGIVHSRCIINFDIEYRSMLSLYTFFYLNEIIK